MSRSRVLGLAALAALALAFVPWILPAGPSSSLDASGLLASGQMFVAVGVIFLGGFLTSLTPCVYPLIPITVGVFGARQADSRGRAFLLTTSYVVGMGIVFALLGVIAAMSGKAFGSALGNRGLVVGLALFLVILATSMFGAFDLTLPSGLATKLNGVGGGGVIGALLMGSVAGFLAAPCTGPVLTGVLAWVSRTQNPVLGAALLFVYAMGIGVPFFLIGVFTVRLPKGGVWMEWVKSVFGIALLALAISYIRDAFPSFGDAVHSVGSRAGLIGGVVTAAFMTFVGVLVGAVHRSFKEPREWALKAAGVAAVLMAFVLRMSVGTELPAPQLQGDGPPSVLAWSLDYKPPDDVKEPLPLQQALANAATDCKPVMIDFYADWCAACKELDQFTYVAREVIDESKRFVALKVDGTNENDALNALYSRYGIQGLPTVVFIDGAGKVLESPRVTGFLKPEKFLQEMRKVGVATCSRSP